jgi:hypothetical protein
MVRRIGLRMQTPDESGDEFTLATYAYDALGRRISKVVDNISAFSGTTYYYYSKKWQMLESHAGRDRIGSVQGESGYSGDLRRSLRRLWSCGSRSRTTAP